MRLILKSIVCLVISTAAFSADPIRILPIGDSITQGGRKDREEYTYRHPLFCLLKDAGIAADFIGTRNKGLQPEATWPDYKGTPFDGDHEGYYGAKTAFVRDQLKTNLPKLAPPDFALIHLGTNDQAPETFSETIVKPLEEIIALLRARNPKVVVLVAHLNFNGGAAIKIRPLVEEMAKRLNTADSPVLTVAHYENWKENPKDPATDTFDWAHPNPQGQKKMAEKWLAAMKPYLKAKP
jgi:lysophospholipase L1-like esterase